MQIDYLLDAYVKRMLSREIRTVAYVGERIPSQRLTIKWLIYLAKQLQREYQTEFLIEKMQLSWLKDSNEKWTYRTVFGLLSALIVGIIFKTFDQLHIGLIGGFQEIKPVESFHFNIANKNWKDLFKDIIYGLITGLAFGLIGGLIGKLFFRLTGGLIAGLPA